MPNILGYGEDALTYSAITQRCAELLKNLDDNTDPNAALSIYRPSFGRRAANHVKPRQTPRSEFGEFDAIVATSAAIYLIESKWHGASVIRDASIVLRTEQIHRHEVFEWYLNMRRDNPKATWNDFVNDHGTAFSQQFGPTRIASPTSLRITQNLQYLLDELVPISTATVHVLLYFSRVKDLSRVGDNLPTKVVTEQATNVKFKVVNMSYTPLGASGFFSLT